MRFSSIAISIAELFFIFKGIKQNCAKIGYCGRTDRKWDFSEPQAADPPKWPSVHVNVFSDTEKLLYINTLTIADKTEV
jgi:hypothetical protein